MSETNVEPQVDPPWKHRLQAVRDWVNGVTHLKSLDVARAKHDELLSELSDLMSTANHTIVQAVARENNPPPPDHACYDCPVYQKLHRRATD